MLFYLQIHEYFVQFVNPWIFCFIYKFMNILFQLQSHECSVSFPNIHERSVSFTNSWTRCFIYKVMNVPFHLQIHECAVLLQIHKHCVSCTNPWIFCFCKIPMNISFAYSVFHIHFCEDDMVFYYLSRFSKPALANTVRQPLILCNTLNIWFHWLNLSYGL